MDKQLVDELLKEHSEIITKIDDNKPLDWDEYEPEDDECVLCTTNERPGYYIDWWSGLCDKHRKVEYWLDDGSTPGYYAWWINPSDEAKKQIMSLSKNPGDIRFRENRIEIDINECYYVDIDEASEEEWLGPSEAAFALAHRLGVKFFFLAY